MEYLTFWTGISKGIHSEMILDSEALQPAQVSYSAEDAGSEAKHPIQLPCTVYDALGSLRPVTSIHLASL
jgi:hypothetical protein